MWADVIEVRITVGRFTLALGGRHGTRADPAPRPDPHRGKKLARAHRARRKPTTVTTAATAMATIADEAEQVTAAVERADEIVQTLARGLTLDPKILEQQAELLLALFERADRDGRFDDERRLARALVALLALIPRWLALLEVLRRVASAAAAVGDRAAEAWAHHELGTFGLAADDASLAADHLERAHSLRDALGDRDAAEVSRHNLELVSFIPESGWLWSRLVRRPVVAVVAALALLAGGGLAAAIIARDGGTNGATATASTTAETETDTETGGTTDTIAEEDTVAPTVILNPLAPFVGGMVDVTATAEDGDSGVASVSFSAARAAAAATALGEDAGAPFAAVWDTTTGDDGEYTVEAVAADVAGNRSEADRVATVVDNTPPTVSVGEAEPGDSGTTLTAKAEDAGSGVERVVFEVAPAPEEGVEPEWSEIGAGVQSDAPLYEFAVDYSGYSSGQYLYRAHAFDAVGNEGVTEDVGRFVVPVD